VRSTERMYPDSSISVAVLGHQSHSFVLAAVTYSVPCLLQMGSASPPMGRRPLSARRPAELRNRLLIQV
jgi:hypothetical protein